MTRLTAAALLTAGAAAAGEPAARLLPATSVDRTVSRGYAPEPGTFGDTKPKTVKPPVEQRAWTGNPLLAQKPAPVAQPQVPPHPAMGGVYAGPPAYRWYGYGTTTPGANPLAPTGNYPKGSANWYAQTGATPGAFPVPVSAGGDPLPRFDPPAYAAAPQPPEPQVAMRPRPVPSFAPPAAPVPYTPPVVAAPTVVPPPAVAKVEPPALIPTEPKPIAVSVDLPPAVAKVEPPPAAPAGLTWQSAAAQQPAPAFTAARPAEPIAQSHPTPPPPVEPPAPVFAPTPAPSVAPPPPAPLPTFDWKAAPQARGQQPTAAAVALADQVRSACYGLATVVEVVHTGPSTLSVRLAAATRADAERAAADASKLPALKPYTVKFLAELGGR